VFLLDDVFGELDTKRSVKISAYLREVGQAFITITDFSNYGFLSKLEGDKIIRVTKGTVAYE
jgi:DNA replication and repair protein RecF